jgi:sugar lactone lactonase YvrE
MKKLIAFLFIGLSSILSSCSSSNDDNTQTTFASQINFTTPSGIYPEGIAYYPQKEAFLVSSITKGQIGMVDKLGNYSMFLDNENFYSTVGLKIYGNKLYVAVGDLGLSNRSTATSPTTIARLLIFDLTSKALLNKIDLDTLYSGSHFANDLCVNASGDIYITDSFSPVIYKVSENGTPEVFVTDPRFSGNGINLNGILEHPDGYLLVAKNSDGKLFKVDLRTKIITEVVLSSPIIGMDGLLLLTDGSLLVGQNTNQEAYHKLVSTNRFATATITATDSRGLDFATTATLVNGQPYFLNTYISDLFKSVQVTTRTSYFIRKFEAVGIN